MEDCVTVKKLTLYVSTNARLPENITEWSTEDTELILSVGYSAFIQAKQSINTTNYQEVVSELERSLSKKYEESLNASLEKIDKTERELQYQKERIKLMQDEEDAQIQRRVSQSKEAFEISLEIYKKDRDELERSLSKKYEDVINASREKIDNIERELQYQKERIKLMQDEEDAQIQRRVSQSKEAFDILLESYKREKDEMQSRIFQLERENDTVKTTSRQFQLETEQRIHKDAVCLIGRELESMRQMLNEKDKQIETHKEMFERSIAKVDNLTQKRDVASIGKIGEGQFKGLAMNTFRDFDGFQLKEVCSIGGLGDFHLNFKELVILVDSKLYTNKVNSTSRDKIKRDLLNNEHINFAWLVSMDTSIDRFDKAPFMFEWISSHKCICYINNLRGHEEPGELIRSVWYCCNALKQMMTTDANEKGELSVLKEREMKMRDVVAKLAKSNRERDTLWSQLRQNFERSDEYLRELMNKETAEIVNDYYLTVVEWWNLNLESTMIESSIKSTVVWTQFKRDMGDKLGKIDSTTFKDVLCGFLSDSKLVKPKTKGGALELRGFKFKDGVKLYDYKK